MLSIIIPTYNEQRTIRELVNHALKVRYPIDVEVIIIDDSSIDRTLQITTLLRLKRKMRNIRLFRNKANKGKGYSIRKGIAVARGEIIIVQDADHEYDPHDIPRLIQPILDGETNIVYGSRFLKKKRPDGMAVPNWIANVFLTKMTNALFGTNLTDMETCYKAFRSDILKNLPLMADRFTFEPEITALIAKRKLQILELPINYSGRTAKKGKKIRAKDFLFAFLMLLKHRLTN